MAGEPSAVALASPLGRIFICYRRDDTQRAAQRLAAALARVVGNQHVFLDQRGLRAGERWRERLRAEVTRSEVVLVLIGRSWLNASASGKDQRRCRLGLKARSSEPGKSRLDEPEDLVRRELEWAIEARCHIVPVLVDGAGLPKTERLPESVRELTEREYRELHTAQQSDFDNDVERLLYELGVHPGLIHTARSAESDRRRRRGMRLAWAMVMALGGTGLTVALVARLRSPSASPRTEVSANLPPPALNLPPPADATRSIDVRLMGESDSSDCGLPAGARLVVGPIVTGTTAIDRSSLVVDCASRMKTGGGSGLSRQRLRLEGAPGFDLDPDVIEVTEADQQFVVRVKAQPKHTVPTPAPAGSRSPSEPRALPRSLDVKLTCSDVVYCIATGATVELRRTNGRPFQASVDAACMAHFEGVVIPNDEQVSLALLPRDASTPFNCGVAPKRAPWSTMDPTSPVPIQNCFCQGPDPRNTDFDCSSPC